jgi:PAS domain S-box-containing protein
LRRIHAAASDFGVFVLDPAGHVMSWNELAELASGYRADEILGHKLSFLYTETENGRLARALTFAAASGRCEDQAMLVGKGNASIQAEIAVTAVRDGNRNLCGFACVIRDISSRTRGEREFRNVRDAAVEFSRLKSTFLANISHEFRTPLNIILGYSDLIAEHLAEVRDTSQKDCFEAVARASNRLIRTLNAVQDYAQLESRSLPVNPRPVILIPLLRGLLNEVEPQALRKDLALVVAIEDEDAVTIIDEYCLRQALHNLIDNAIKFTERGSVTTRVYREPGGTICIGISDTGIGIGGAYMQHLMEPFSQEDSGITRRFEGVGLGLALTHRYLELNGARLTVQSEKGRGSNFTIHFASTSTFAPGRFELSHKPEDRWIPPTKR